MATSSEANTVIESSGQEDRLTSQEWLDNYQADFTSLLNILDPDVAKGVAHAEIERIQSLRDEERSQYVKTCINNRRNDNIKVGTFLCILVSGQATIVLVQRELEFCLIDAIPKVRNSPTHLTYEPAVKSILR